METELTAVENAWALDAAEVLERLNCSPERGLTGSEVLERRQKFGVNQLRETETRGAWLIFFAQFKSLIVLLLAVAAGLSFAFQEWIESGAIVAVILINAAIGFFTEWRAVRSMEALRRLTEVEVTVRRNGTLERLQAEELVPGDIVIVEGGDVVAADMRIFQASRLQVDESSLTGESVPVGKHTESSPEETILNDRRGMLYKGTAVTRGAGEGVVVATGMESELGRISSLIEEAETEDTPLEKRLERLGRKLIWVTLLTAIATAVVGIRAGKDVYLMIETSIALAVAAIPEGLPIVATMALARGMWRMARRNALVNRLSAVETLGTTGVICTDKTGTLTENRMEVMRFVLADEEIELPQATTTTFLRNGNIVDPERDPLLAAALEVSVLCNDASFAKNGVSRDRGVGDPLELALLAAAARAGLDREAEFRKHPRIREEAFDPELKMMAAYHRGKPGTFCVVSVKGAAEAVLQVSTKILNREGVGDLSDDLREHWLEENRRLANDGLRVLALALKELGDGNESEAAYENLTFVGLVGLLDPARRDVRKAIEDCKASGMRVVMVTGDQMPTAVHVARSVGLLEEPREGDVLPGSEIKDPRSMTSEERERIRGAVVLARVTPKQKLDLIELHQRNSEVVAMTGDGVNDAPALKKADIGIAMGQRGTDVAREAADMVLKDDAFSTIVVAVREGRIIFDNIRKFVFYLLSCNLSEILVVGLAAAVNAPLPILPLQLLFLNLVTDVFPALALGAGEGSDQVMNRPPRASSEELMEGKHWLAVIIYSATIAGSVLGALLYALQVMQMSAQEAVSVSFLVLALAQLWHVFNTRDAFEAVFMNSVTRNLYVWGALILCAGLILAAVYAPGLSTLLKVEDPGREGWPIIIVASVIPLVLGQLYKAVARRPARG